MDFDMFVSGADESSGLTNYSLRLMAAICHRGGRTVNSGHYIAYVVDGGALIRFDDLCPGQRVGRATGLETSTGVLYDELARDAYLLLYELVRRRCRISVAGMYN